MRPVSINEEAHEFDIDGLVQDCAIHLYTSNALGIMLSCTKSSIWPYNHYWCICLLCVKGKGEWLGSHINQPHDSLVIWDPFYPITFRAERGIVVTCLCPSVCLPVRPSVYFISPHDNSSEIWAEFTKFAPNMHLGICSAGIANGCHWPWSSRSFGHFNSVFQETVLNDTFVYRSRPVRRCYTSQRALVLTWFNFNANMDK